MKIKWVEFDTDFIKQLDYVMLNKFVFPGKTEESDVTLNMPTHIY
jgi:hypothetical protein